nr:MAG TPA: hypothetical protein [Caudoviricetes sp.]
MLIGYLDHKKGCPVLIRAPFLFFDEFLTDE